MNAAFRRILVISGSALVLQGLLDIVLGPWLHLGEAVSAGADSDARFLGGLLVAVGVVWIALSRRGDLPFTGIRLLAGGMILGAVGRLVSVAVAGPGSVFGIALIAVEILSSTAVIVLSIAASRQVATGRVAAEQVRAELVA